MADRPIIFSAPMITALIAGRKTMTRRPASSPLRKATPGDRLYVRETWAHYHTINHMRRPSGASFAEVSDGLAGYRADGFDAIEEFRYHVRLMSGVDLEGIEIYGDKWRPSIHMPRWASRLTLVVTEVRFEQLQDISEVDARAEGIPPVRGPNPGDEIGWQSFETYPDGKPHPHAIAPNREARRSFRELWEMLHGAGSWEANPQLVVLTFDVLPMNIDLLTEIGS